MKPIIALILATLFMAAPVTSYAAVSEAEKQHIESHPLWFLIENVNGSDILAGLSNRSYRCKADAIESQKVICRERVNKDIALMKKNGINVTVAQMFDPIFRKYQEIAIKRALKHRKNNMFNGNAADKIRHDAFVWKSQYTNGQLLNAVKDSEIQ